MSGCIQSVESNKLNHGKRKRFHFFKPSRRSQLSERDKQQSIELIIAYVSKGKCYKQASKTKAACFQYRWEGQSSNSRGITTAPFEGHWMGTSSATPYVDSPSYLSCSVVSWNLLLASTEQLKRDFQKTRCLEKPCQSAVVLVCCTPSLEL